MHRVKPMTGWLFKWRSRRAPDSEGESGQDELGTFLTLISISVELFGIGLAALAAAVGFRRDGYGPFFLLGGIASLAMSALMASTAFKSVRDEGSDPSMSAREEDSYEYRSDLGVGSDVPAVVMAGRGVIGDAHPDEDLLTKRIGENREILHIYGRERSSARSLEFAGYTLIYPLTKEAADRIRAGLVRSAAELDDGSLHGL